MRLAVLTEKPHVARLAAPHVQRAFPDADLNFLVCWPVSLCGPPLPRGLAWRDYPHIAPFEVDRFMWRDRGDTPLSHPLVGRVRADGTLPMEPNRERFTHRLQAADRIIAFVDPSSQAYHMDVVLRKVRGHGLQGSQARLLLALDDASLEAHAAGPCPGDDALATRLVAQGQVRHYFDHQFAINSVAVLARTLGESAWVSKYQIQTLYLVARQGPVGEGELLRRMGQWPGTGRYPRESETDPVGLGSPMSRAAILNQLVARGWAERRAIPNQRSCKIVLASRGVAALRALHPRCEDPDLPFRLCAWSLQGLSESKPAMDRYIRAFFGRQKRFSGTVGKRSLKTHFSDA